MSPARLRLADVTSRTNEIMSPARLRLATLALTCFQRVVSNGDRCASQSCSRIAVNSCFGSCCSFGGIGSLLFTSTLAVRFNSRNRPRSSMTGSIGSPTSHHFVVRRRHSHSQIRASRIQIEHSPAKPLLPMPTKVYQSAISKKWPRHDMAVCSVTFHPLVREKVSRTIKSSILSSTRRTIKILPIQRHNTSNAVTMSIQLARTHFFIADLYGATVADCAPTSVLVSRTMETNRDWLRNGPPHWPFPLFGPNRIETRPVRDCHPGSWNIHWPRQ
jgi:hypothetical protein